MNFTCFQIHDALEHENDDIDSSGSGYGDDEDDIHTSKDKESRLNKETHHSSGDGSDHSVYRENTDFDTEIHEDKKQLPIDSDQGLYFESTSISTSTDRKIFASTTEDDEDSQFKFYFILILSRWLLFFTPFQF